MTQQEINELKEQIKKELVEEKLQEKKNRQMSKRVLDEYEKKLPQFIQNDPWVSGQLRTALSTIIRVSLDVKKLADIPSEKELRLRNLIEGIFYVCSPYWDVIKNKKSVDIFINEFIKRVD